MWNIPNKRRLAKIPRLYETEHIPLKEKLIYLHFFLAGSDWFAAEYNGRDLFWGFVILNQDFINSEWGYFSFKELKQIKVGPYEIDCELEENWKIRPASEIDKIKT